MHNPSMRDHSCPLSARDLVTLALAALLMLAGCDSNDVADEPEPEIADVVISPDSASFAVDEQVDFSVVALTASGDTVQDAGLDVEWWSSDPDVFTVESGGTATGRNSGTAFCKVELSDDAANAANHLKAAKRRFVGRDSAFVMIF